MNLTYHILEREVGPKRHVKKSMKKPMVRGLELRDNLTWGQRGPKAGTNHVAGDL